MSDVNVVNTDVNNVSRLAMSKDRIFRLQGRDVSCVVEFESFLDTDTPGVQRATKATVFFYTQQFGSHFAGADDSFAVTRQMNNEVLRITGPIFILDGMIASLGIL